MTTLTTILALIPLVLGVVEGAAVQVPMASAVISGLPTYTLIDLELIPAVYSQFHYQIRALSKPLHGLNLHDQYIRYNRSLRFPLPF